MDLPALTQPINTLRAFISRQLTASGDSLATIPVPYDCRILQIRAGVNEIGGTVDPTDVDVDVENGTVDLCDPLPAVDGSAVAAGGVSDTPDSGQESLSAGDILHVDVDITGGTSPTVDGVWVEVDVVRTNS